MKQIMKFTITARKELIIHIQQQVINFILCIEVNFTLSGIKQQYDLLSLDLCIHPIQTIHTTPYSKQLHHTCTLIGEVLLFNNIIFGLTHSVYAQHANQTTTWSLSRITTAQYCQADLAKYPNAHWIAWIQFPSTFLHPDAICLQYTM